MTIVIPDARTPAGVKCWVRDSDGRCWEARKFSHIDNAMSPAFRYSDGDYRWNQCRLDDPETGWVENTGVQPVADSTKVEVKFAKAAPSAVSAASNWHWSIEFAVGDITHWRYPRETKEKPMAPHPQADILRRIADGEDLKDRVWSFSHQGGRWVQCNAWAVLINPDWTFAVSDKPNIPPPLPRKKITLREGGPWYYQGETVAPASGTEVWVARAAVAEMANHFLWRDRDSYGQEAALRLGLVHLTEENYSLHMAALEDFLLWVKERVE